MNNTDSALFESARTSASSRETFGFGSAYPNSVGIVGRPSAAHRFPQGRAGLVAAIIWLAALINPAISSAQTNHRGCEATRIEEGYFANINGVDQWVTIRGDSRCNPVLIYLHGGPGMAASSGAPLYASWEKDY